MALSDEQYQARMRYLKSRVAELLLPADIHDKITYLSRALVEHFDDIETVLFDDLDEERARSLHRLLADAESSASGFRLGLSLKDCFDLERISLLAEHDLAEFFAGDPKWSAKEISELTDALTQLRRAAFPEDIPA